MALFHSVIRFHDEHSFLNHAILNEFLVPTRFQFDGNNSTITIQQRSRLVVEMKTGSRKW